MKFYEDNSSTLENKVLLVWDNAAIHKTKEVSQILSTQKLVCLQ